MAWSIAGRYFESCNCDVVCPCSASPRQGADYDECRTVIAFHVDAGAIEEIDVGGLTVAVIGVLPKYLLQGNWRLGLLVDEAASAEQARKLEAVFSGRLGGPPAAISSLIGEHLGVQRAPMRFSAEGGKHMLIVGDRGRVAVADLVPTGAADGPPARLTSVFHPATAAGLSQGELTLGKAEPESQVEAFGIRFANGGKSALSASFSWAG